MRHGILPRVALVIGMLASPLGIVSHAQEAAPSLPSQAPGLQYMKVCNGKNPPPCADTAPKAIYSPDPSYSDEAREAKIEGIVILWTVVGVDGRARYIRVSQSVGHGLDEQAIKTLKEWKFKPGTSKGIPVPVLVDVKVAFKLS